MTRSHQDLIELDQEAMLSTQPGPDGQVHAKSNRWAHRAVGIVLAGGQAQRMDGLDKPLIEVAGQSMVRRVADRLSPQVDQCLVNGNGDLARLDIGLPMIADDLGGQIGPLAGILAAMRWSQTHAPHAFWVISAASDTPFFPADLVDRFVGAMGGPDPAVVLAKSGENLHPTFGLWPVVLADDLEAFLTRGERKVRKWAQSHICSEAVFSGPTIDGLEIDPFFNVNYPDDIDVAEAIADGLADGN